MRANKPIVDPEARYDISQACELLGIHRESLRKYTHQTKEINCGYRKIGNKLRKYYLGSEILRFWQTTDASL